MRQAHARTRLHKWRALTSPYAHESAKSFASSAGRRYLIVRWCLTRPVFTFARKARVLSAGCHPSQRMIPIASILRWITTCSSEISGPCWPIECRRLRRSRRRVDGPGIMRLMSLIRTRCWATTMRTITWYWRMVFQDTGFNRARLWVALSLSC